MFSVTRKAIAIIHLMFLVHNIIVNPLQSMADVRALLLPPQGESWQCQKPWFIPFLEPISELCVPFAKKLITSGRAHFQYWGDIYLLTLGLQLLDSYLSRHIRRRLALAASGLVLADYSQAAVVPTLELLVEVYTAIRQLPLSPEMEVMTVEIVYEVPGYGILRKAQQLTRKFHEQPLNDWEGPTNTPSEVRKACQWAIDAKQRVKSYLLARSMSIWATYNIISPLCLHDNLTEEALKYERCYTRYILCLYQRYGARARANKQFKPALPAITRQSDTQEIFVELMRVESEMQRLLTATPTMSDDDDDDNNNNDEKPITEPFNSNASIGEVASHNFTFPDDKAKSCFIIYMRFLSSIHGELRDTESYHKDRINEIVEKCELQNKRNADWLAKTRKWRLLMKNEPRALIRRKTSALAQSYNERHRSQKAKHS